jgi:hypothetical protein
MDVREQGRNSTGIDSQTRNCLIRTRRLENDEAGFVERIRCDPPAKLVVLRYQDGGTYG